MPDRCRSAGVFVLLALCLGCTDPVPSHESVGWMNPVPDNRRIASSGLLALDRAVDEHVIEDAGGEQGEPQDITGMVVLRKELDVPATVPLEAVTSATLEVHLFEAITAPVALRIDVNGTSQSLQPGDGPRGFYRWREIPLSPSILRYGINVITLSPAAPAGQSAWGVLTRRSTYPDRSARSRDGGRTWDRDHLSNDNLQNGEYSIRLRLEAPAQVTVFSDLRVLPEDVRRLGRLARPWQTGAAHYQVRTGPTAIPGAGWTEWARLPTGEHASVLPDHEYVQTAVTVRGLAPWATLALEPLGEPDEELDDVNSWLPYGSRFRYQDPTHQTLRALRHRESLDRIVGTAGEALLVARLRDWVRRQFPDGNPDPYPPFNALTILDWIRAKKTGGFCGQHAFILGQALLSYGLQIRHVELGMNTPTPTGPAYFPAVHFALEYWSPAHRKWIFVDPNKNVQATLNGTPLSAREIHDLYVEYFDRALRRDPSRGSTAGDPRRVVRRPSETRTVPGLGDVTVTTWDLHEAGRLQVEHGPTDGGSGWSLEYFYYVRVRLRNDELMYPSQFHEDLPAISPRNEDGFNPNGMLRYMDARTIPVQQRIAIYSTASAAEFDWRLDLVDVHAEGKDPVRIRAVTTWPYPSAFVLRGKNLTRTSSNGTFEITPAEFSAEDLQVQVLDTAGRVVAAAPAGPWRH